MRTSSLVWIVILIIVIGGGWYVLSHEKASQGTQEAAQGPSQAMGINGSPNQGNMGATSTGSVQEPGMTGPDGSDISVNITLGTDGNATLGKYLIGWTGNTVYTFKKDSVGTSTCYDACAQKWPPYLVPAGMHLNIASGVNAALAGTIVRADGKTQMTYKGMPLYFYQGDTSGSDTKGQGIGNNWYVVKP